MRSSRIARDSNLCFLSLTYEVLLKTSVSAGFWFAAMKNRIALFDRTNKIVYIFSYKYLKHKSCSFFQKNIGDIHDRKVQFDRAVLIYTGLTSGGWSDIGSQTIESSDTPSFKEFDNGGRYEDVTLK